MTPAFSTTAEVLSAMEQRVDWLRTQSAYASFIPFLYTYYLVTRRVIQADQQEHLFTNSDALRRLDVFFAQQYFAPLDTFLSTGSGPTPWTTYYRYCSSPHPKAFVATLLGINAHINGDLPFALALSPYNLKVDFNQVDRLLSEVVSDLMHFLAKECNDIQARVATFLPGFTTHEFYKIVIQWRHQAWENAQLITSQHFNEQSQSIHMQTEQVAEQIIRMFHHPIRSVFHYAAWHKLKVKLNHVWPYHANV